MIFLTLKSDALEYLQLWTFHLNVSISSSFSPFLPLCGLAIWALAGNVDSAQSSEG